MRKEIFLCREAFVKTRNTARASAMSIRYNSDHRFSQPKMLGRIIPNFRAFRA